MVQGETQIVNVQHGSPPYMAPESIRTRCVTKACDVYAFGILMWELWHNIMWCAVYEIESKRRAKAGKKTPLMEMASFKPECHHTCPPEYAELVRHCLEADPARRPRMKTIVRRLESCLHDLGSFMSI